MSTGVPRAGDELGLRVGLPTADGSLRIGGALHRLSAAELAAWRGAPLGSVPERLVQLGAVVPVRLGTDAAVDVARAHRLLGWPGVLDPAQSAAAFLAECTLLRSLWAQCAVLAARAGERGRAPDPALHLTGVLAEVHRLVAAGAASLDRAHPDAATTWPPVAARRPGASTGPPPHWPARAGWDY